MANVESSAGCDRYGPESIRLAGLYFEILPLMVFEGAVN
jgi:hypothetical protein